MPYVYTYIYQQFLSDIQSSTLWNIEKNCFSLSQ